MSRYGCLGVVCVLLVGCGGDQGGGGATTSTAGVGGGSSGGGSSAAATSGIGNGTGRGGSVGAGGVPATGGGSAGTSSQTGGQAAAGAATGGHPACVPGAANAPNAAAPLRDDRDGQTYATIKIGAQVWMAQNLNVGERVAGIPEWPGENDDSKIEKFCVDDLPENCAVYGGLYTWPEAMGLTSKCSTQSCASLVSSPQRGICPTGWHIPTQGEWSTLGNSLASLTGLTAMSTEFADMWSDLGLAMKAATCWKEGSNGTNATGFNAIPAGWRHAWGGFNAVGTTARLHSTTELNVNYVEGRGIDATDSSFFRATYYGDHAVSVRCVKD